MWMGSKFALKWEPQCPKWHQFWTGLKQRYWFLQCSPEVRLLTTRCLDVKRLHMLKKLTAQVHGRNLHESWWAQGPPDFLSHSSWKPRSCDRKTPLPIPPVLIVFRDPSPIGDRPDAPMVSPGKNHSHLCGAQSFQGTRTAGPPGWGHWAGLAEPWPLPC